MTPLSRVDLENVFFDTRKDVERVIRRRLGWRGVTSDLVQDVYLKCRQAEIDFPDRHEARAYLLRMAANLAIDHLRVEGRRSEILTDLMPVYDGYSTVTESPEVHALANDKVRQIESVLAELPKLTRQMFVLARLHGMTHREVAERLGVSKSLVDEYMVQALLRCRDALGGLDGLD